MLAVAFVGAAAATGCSMLADAMPSSVIQPRIVPSAAQSGSLAVTREFAFENSTVKLSVPVDRAVLAGAASAQKSAVFIGGEQPGDWVGDYYRAFIGEKQQEAFYTAMLQALHQARQQQGLDESRYVDLVASMVQTLEYKTDPGSLAPKFPIETFGNGYGDCDDKTLLAAALLSREGYDVAVLLFEPEKHVALGIRAPGLDYKKTGYAYVEVTGPSLVGVPVERLSGGARLTSQPVVIKVGDGTGAFGAGEQIAYIQQRLRDMAAAEEQLKGMITAQQKELSAGTASLNREREALKAITDPTALQMAVERYNQQVDEFNSLTAKVNQLVARYNGLVEIEKYVASHQTSRPQVYERVRAAGL
jgi:hypothetical protein